MNLKKIRKEKRVNQKDLADLLNVTQQNISNFENNISQLNAKQIITLCKYLNVSADELLGIKTNQKQAEIIINKHNTNLSINDITKAKETLDKITELYKSLIKKE